MAVDYEALPSSQDEEFPVHTAILVQFPSPSKRRRTVRLVSIISTIINIIGVIWLAQLVKDRSSYVVWRGARPIYTPADEIVSHHDDVPGALASTSKYHGPPTDEVDANWEALYVPYMVTSITKKDALRLENPHDTAPWDSDSTKFATQIEVFHHLHCLNLLRQLAWPERYPGTESNRFAIAHGVVFNHADHCIQAIRESLQCSAPLAALPWQFNPLKNHSEIRFDALRTCGDFKALQQWALDHPPPPDIVAADHLNVTLPKEFAPSREQLIEAGWITEDPTH